MPLKKQSLAPRQEIAEPTTDPQRQPSPQSAVKPLLGGKHPRGTSRFRTPYCVVIRASGTNCGSDITFRKLFLHRLIIRLPSQNSVIRWPIGQIATLTKWMGFSASQG